MARKKRVKPRFWLMMMTVMLLVFGFLYYTESRFMQQQQNQIEALAADRDQIVADNAVLERKIAFSMTDEYIERAARTDFGLLKPGETRFVGSSGAVYSNAD